MKKSNWSPSLPKGSIIKDPVVFNIPESFPRTIFIPLDICRIIDPSPVCPTFWERKITLPPIPIKLIWQILNKSDLPYPSHAKQFQKVQSESNFGIVILKKPPYHAPGVFEVYPWSGSEDDANAILQ